MNRHPDRYDNATERPWPVSPYKYPLTGPKRGPVYVPPEAAWETKSRVLVNLAYLAAMMFAFGFAGYVIAVHIFKGTL